MKSKIKLAETYVTVNLFADESEKKFEENI